MTISFEKVVDLTHTLQPGIPIWPGDPRLLLRPAATMEREGYHLQELALGEHTGTHFGAAAHFMAEGLTADRLPPELLVRPAVVIDVMEEVAADPDYSLTVERIARWEREHGPIAAGSVVLLCTGWSSRWENPAAYIAAEEGNPGAKHAPGFGLDAARYLGEVRGVAGLGIDTHGIDAGMDASFSVNAWWLCGERFHLENLANLHLLPPTGATLFIGPLKIAGSSGGPARVLALV